MRHRLKNSLYRVDSRRRREAQGSYQGLLLTKVAPGTPAALADLRRGDVIVRVNNFDVKSAEDFSYVLNEAGGGATVNFTFFRGQTRSAYSLHCCLCRRSLR